MEKITDFIDCVYDDKMKNVKQALKNSLPYCELYTLPDILIVHTSINMYAIKIRHCYTKDNGDIDLEKIYKECLDREYLRIDFKYDFNDCTTILETIEKLKEIITPGTCVIYRTHKHLKVDGKEV